MANAPGYAGVPKEGVPGDDPRTARRGVKSAPKPFEPTPNRGTTPFPWGEKYLEPRSPFSISISYEQRPGLSSSAERFMPPDALAPAARTGAAGSRRHGAAAGSAVAREQRPPFTPAAEPAIHWRRRSRSVRRGRPARRISPHGKSEITPIRCRTMAYPRIYPLFAGAASDLATNGGYHRTVIFREA